MSLFAAGVTAGNSCVSYHNLAKNGENRNWGHPNPKVKALDSPPEACGNDTSSLILPNPRKILSMFHFPYSIILFEMRSNFRKFVCSKWRPNVAHFSRKNGM